jgi:carboxypeptidase family protein
MRSLCLVAAFVAISGRITAQSPPPNAAILVGRVLDAVDSGAIANAGVQIVGTTLDVRSDGRGYYRISGVPTGAHEIEVRSFRYKPIKRALTFVAGDSVRLDIYMEHVPQLLSEMVVHGRALRVPNGFEAIYARGARGWGTFITREQIDSINPRDVKTMFEGIKGVFVDQNGVFFNRCYGNAAMGAELGELWIDGDRVTKFQTGGRTAVDTRGMNDYLEDIPPREIQAIEVYTSSVDIPAEFTSGGSPCAVIAVWRKRGP